MSLSGVYIALNQDCTLAKIGYSGDICERIRQLRCIGGSRVTPVGYITGGREQESNLHRQFKIHRVCGEWFHYCDALRELVSDNPMPFLSSSWVMVGARIPMQLAQQLLMHCRENGIKVQTVITDALRDYLRLESLRPKPARKSK